METLFGRGSEMTDLVLLLLMSMSNGLLLKNPTVMPQYEVSHGTYTMI